MFVERIHNQVQNVEWHGVVDSSTRSYHLSVVAHLCCFLDEIVRVDRQAVSADPGARIIDIKVPLSRSGTYHLHNIDMQAFEDQGEFIHKGDVEIPLNVLDDFSRFSCLDVLDGHNVLRVVFVELSC